MAEFNLADVLRGVEAQDLGQAGREQIQYIDIDLIDPDPKNFYKLSDLDELAANIELVGLQQPLRVRVHPDDAGRWMIVSGHRRRAAIRQLVDEGKDQLRAVACIVEQPAGSDALQELRLIYANSGTRKLTPAEISRQAERVEMLLYELKEQGMEFPGRMRDHVAEACKVSKSKLSRLKVIREKLIPELLEMFEAGKLSENAAYTAARASIRAQRLIYSGATRGYVNEWQFSGAISEVETQEKIKRCHLGGPCSHVDIRLDKYAEQRRIPCGAYCCAECHRLAKCDFSCTWCSEEKGKAQEQEKAEKAAAREERKAEEAKRAERDAYEYALKVQQFKNYGERRATLGITLKAFYNGYLDATYTDEDLETIERFECGEEVPGQYADSILDYMSYERIAMLAEDLSCTIDYLFGRTDTPQPPTATLESTPVWHDAAAGDLPAEGQSVIAAVQYDPPNGMWVTEDLAFRDGKFKAFGSDMPEDIRIFWQPRFEPLKDVPDSGTEEREELNG